MIYSSPRSLGIARFGPPAFGRAIVFGLALALAAASAPVAALADYPQIRLNTDNTTQLQNEQQIAVNPLDPQNVVACWRDFRLGYRQVGVGYSFDGGTTWTDFLIGGELPWDSDPVLTVHRDGTFYLVVINYRNGAENQLSVHRSTTGGLSWEGPFTAVYSAGFDFEDKEWVAVDRTGGLRDGHVYIAWSRFYDVKIMCVRSTDRGVTWSSPVQVSDPGLTSQWPVPVVLRNGELLVAWDSYDTNRIAYDISLNGGVTWGADRTLTTTSTPAQSTINGGITVFPYPSLVLDETGGPRAGWVYCVYPDAAVGGNGMDIWCRRSTNDGLTWSSRVRVNDDVQGLVRDQFHPWVACDETGVLHATWYDRRNDAGNYLWHIYYAFSTDGGVTWSTNERVTTVASSPGNAGRGEEPSRPPLEGTASQPLALLMAGLIGEYSGVAVRAGVVHPIWTDTRNGHQDTYASVIVSATAIPAPAGGPAAAPVLALRATPNPLVPGGQLHLVLAAPFDRGELAIHHVSGRRLRTLEIGPLPVGENTFTWDGRDEAGRELPNGVYLLRLSSKGALPVRPLIQAKVAFVR